MICASKYVSNGGKWAKIYYDVQGIIIHCKENLETS